MTYRHDRQPQAVNVEIGSRSLGALTASLNVTVEKVPGATPPDDMEGSAEFVWKRMFAAAVDIVVNAATNLFQTPRHALIGTIALLFVAAVLPSCGGGGGSGPVITQKDMEAEAETQTPETMTPEQPDAPDMAETPKPPEPLPLAELPLQLPSHATNAPVVNAPTDVPERRSISIGAGTTVFPNPNALTRLLDHDPSIVVFHGKLKDGLGAEEITAYLQADARADLGDVRRWGDPPVVRIAAGTDPELVSQTVRAVQIINAALPHDWKIRFGAPVASVDYDSRIDGAITVEFAAADDWPAALPREDSSGVAVTNSLHSGEIVSAQVIIDPDRTLTAGLLAEFVEELGLQPEQYELAVLVHEFLHALGRKHADGERFPFTIMTPYMQPIPDYYLTRLDREALLATYGKLSAGTAAEAIATDLGPWDDTSMHVVGYVRVPESLDVIAFGTALQNGLAQPWVLAGPPATVNLADNAELSGSASWSGRLLGLTPQASVVAGAADLSVQLSTLTGALDFTEMESWAAGQPPGAAGTGTQWGDGDLAYTIGVRGNTFIRTGGDAGTVTGAFVGPSHEGMGGTLERADLSAAFGGVR